MNSSIKIRPLKPFALTLTSLSLAPSSTTSPFQTLLSTPKKTKKEVPATDNNTQFKPNKGGFSDFIQFSPTKPHSQIMTPNTDVRRASTGMRLPWESMIKHLRNETKMKYLPVEYSS